VQHTSQLDKTQVWTKEPTKKRHHKVEKSGGETTAGDEIRPKKNQHAPKGITSTLTQVKHRTPLHRKDGAKMGVNLHQVPKFTNPWVPIRMRLEKPSIKSSSVSMEGRFLRDDGTLSTAGPEKKSSGEEEG